VASSAARPLGGVSVRDALDSAQIPLTAAGCDTPRLDAEVLLAHLLGVDRSRLVMEPERPLEPGQARAYQQLVLRRREREPVAYIVGSKGFRHIDLAVDRRVLVPRPETELLVEAALSLPQGARVVDVGTGSGAVALALKHERPDLELVATDASVDALDVARANAARLGLEVAFHHGDLLAGVTGPIDAVVSNPPYVAETDRPSLPPEILVHEPAGALFAGPDGLDTIRRLVAAVADVPWVAIELGAGQAGAVAALLRGRVEILRDLAGIERVVVASTP
jgi:release factor glutamine methyltransferase